jgi:predicted HTH domain antitoxin
LIAGPLAIEAGQTRHAVADYFRMSQVLEIEVPDDVLLGLQKDAKHLAAEMRIAAAVKWYELGQLTQGKAAEVAGLSRAAFINELHRYGVSPFQETANEALKSAMDLAR